MAPATRRGPTALALPAVAVALAVNLPLVYLLVRVAGAGPGSWAREVLTASTGRLLLDTLALLAGVLAVAVALAVPLAWLVARSDLPCRRLLAVVGALPLAVPSYVAAFAVVAVLGPQGFVQGWLEPLGVSRVPELAYGYSGALLTLGLYTYPYIYLPLVGALRGLDPALEESSRALGRGRLATFLAVVLPQLRGTLLSGCLLVALYVISDFGAVSIVRYNTLTLGVFNAYGALFDRDVAAALATVLVGLTVGLVALQAVLLRPVRPTRTDTARPAAPVALGALRGVCLTGFLGVGTLALGLPAGVTIYWAVRAMRVGNPLGTLGGSAFGSLAVSFAAALVALALAIPVAAWVVRRPGRLSRLVERACYGGHALPGLVVALAVVFLATRWIGFAYQTLGLLVAAYVVRFLPEALSAVRAAMQTVGPVFEEAARSLGRRGTAAMLEVTLPLIRPGLLAGAGLVFLSTMKELPATLILRPIGFETLATRVWSAASEGVFSEAALPSLVLLLASAVPVHLLVIRPMLAERIHA